MQAVGEQARREHVRKGSLEATLRRCELLAEVVLPHSFVGAMFAAGKRPAGAGLGKQRSCWAFHPSHPCLPEPPPPLSRGR